MYGVIFDFLRDYVIEKHGGKQTWESLLKDNGYGYKIFFPTIEYKDAEIVALATSASKALNIPLPDVLEDFGSFVAGKLLTFYHMYRGPDSWKSFEIIENAGGCIHQAIHRHNPTRKPPLIKASRASPNELIISYQSVRKLCPVLRGIVRGLGEHFKEDLKIEEIQCMHDGFDECIFHINRNPDKKMILQAKRKVDLRTAVFQ